MRLLFLFLFLGGLSLQALSQLSIETNPILFVAPWRPMAGANVGFRSGNWKIRLGHYVGLRNKVEKRQITDLDYSVTSAALFRYFDLSADEASFYFGVLGAHQPEKMRKSSGYFLRNGHWYRYEDGVVNIDRYKVMLAYGMDIALAGNFRMHCGWGVGLNFRHVWHEAPNATLDEDFFNETLILPKGTRAGRSILPSLYLDFGLIYIIGRKN